METFRSSIPPPPPEIPGDTRPIIYRYLGDILNQREQDGLGNFVTIEGVSIDVDNLIDAISGREFIPLLNGAEILANAKHGGDHSDLNHRCYYHDYQQPGPRREAVRKRVGKARDLKSRQIQKLVKRYLHGKSPKGLPRRDVILAALADMSYPFFNSLTDFIARTAQLNTASANAAITAGQETAVEPSSRAIKPASVEKISESPKSALIARLLKMTEEELANVSIIILEKAALDHHFNQDDAHQLVIASNPPAIEIPSFNREIQTIFGVYISALVVIGGSLIFDQEVAKCLIAAAGAVDSLIIGNLLVSHVTGKTIRNVIRSVRFKTMVGGLRDNMLETHQVLKDRIGTLEQSSPGRIRMTTLREILLQHNGALPKDDEILSTLNGFIERLETDASVEIAFEDFCHNRTAQDFSSSQNALRLIEDFDLFLGARRELDCAGQHTQVEAASSPITTSRGAMATIPQ